MIGNSPKIKSGNANEIEFPFLIDKDKKGAPTPLIYGIYKIIDLLKFENQKRKEIEKNFFSILLYFHKKNSVNLKYNNQLMNDLKYPEEEIQVKSRSEFLDDIIIDLQNEFGKDIYFEPKDEKLLIILEEDNIDKSIDQIFAEFLNIISSLVNSIFFLKIVCFIILLRDCLNTSYFIFNLPKTSQYEKLSNSFEFTQCYNAENVPEIANYFVSVYLENKDINSISELISFSKEEIVRLIKHFCHWLFENNYTNFKLTHI